MSQWHYRVNNREVGPVSASELKEAASDGTITPDTLVRLAAGDRWVPARKVKGLNFSKAPSGGNEAQTDVDASQPAVAAVTTTTELSRQSVPEQVKEVTPATPSPNLLPCPDCSKLVSKRASQCPDCGCPLKGAAVEARLTIGRGVRHPLFSMKIKLDGVDIFTLGQGQKGSCVVSPGKHVVSGTLGWGVFDAQGEMAIIAEEGKHLQLLAEVVFAFPVDKLTFSECYFEGKYDY